MISKITCKLLTTVFLMGISCENFAQTTVLNQNTSIAMISKTASDSHSSIVLGVALSASQFKKITQYNQAKAVTNPSDFCVGIIDDDELSKSIENIQ